VRSLADVDLGARNQRETVSPEDAALDRIRALEMLVDRPEIRRVEMLGEREAVEPDPTGHAHHAFHRHRVELEMLGHLRVRVGIDPLQTVRLLSEFIHNRPQPSTVQNHHQPEAKRPCLRAPAQRTQYIVACVLQDRK